MRIMICTIDSPAVYKMTDYLAELFPHAEYHLVTVIKPVRQRIVLTKYYERIIYEAVVRAQDNVESLLRKHGISAVFRHVLRGRPSDELEKYSEAHRVDIAAITPRATAECRGLGRTARHLIEKARRPILLYTPLSDVPFTPTLHVALIDEAVIPENIRAEMEKAKNLVEERIRSSDLSGKITGYDLLVSTKKKFLELVHLHVCQSIWSPILIVP